MLDTVKSELTTGLDILRAQDFAPKTHPQVGRRHRAAEHFSCVARAMP